MKRRILAGAVAVATVAAVYALIIEPRWIEVRRSRIHLRSLPPGLEGLRIGLLTDFHAGGLATPLRTVRRAVELVMSAKPEMIALAGDFAVDSVTSFAPVFDSLRGLDAPLGVYAVPGNHDHKIGIDLWKRE